MQRRVKHTAAEIKCIMKQLIEGVNYLHSQKIIHRDLKTANILVSNKGEVQIADFGLARRLNSMSGNYTPGMVTIWYRAPELLLGATKYTTQVDVWSIGCIMAELILGGPLFPGDKEFKQCDLIFKICGTPDERNWPNCKELPHFSVFVPSQHHERNLKNYMLSRRPGLDSKTLDFLDRLLALDPEKRLTCQQALEHDYFHSDPLPCDLKDMPRIQDECHITLIVNNKKKKESEKRQTEENKVLCKRNHNEIVEKKKFMMVNLLNLNPFHRSNPVSLIQVDILDSLLFLLT